MCPSSDGWSFASGSTSERWSWRAGRCEPKGSIGRAVFRGRPVVKVGRGKADGFARRCPPFLSGTNLTATKARLLLMACLMKYGSLPVAADPGQPTPAEYEATMARL